MKRCAQNSRGPFGNPRVCERVILENLVIAVLYFIGAKFALIFAISPGNVSTFWAPSGIALSAVLIFGFHLWPGIWVGEFLANSVIFQLSTPAVAMLSLTAGIGMTTGTLLEVLIAAKLIQQYIGKHNPFDRLRDVAIFLGIAPLACVVGSTCGAASLFIGGLLPADRVPIVWLTWLVGDTAGMLVIAPLILSFYWAGWPKWGGRKWIELVFFVGSTLTYGAAVFLLYQPRPSESYPLELLILPLITWGTLRFTTLEVTLTILLLAGIALFGTIHHTGPYAGRAQLDTQLVLLMFVGILSGLSLSMSAISSQQRQSERSLLEAKRAAEAAAQARAEFLSVAAHELRTPVTSLLLSAEVARRQRMQRTKVDPSLERIMTQTKRIARLVEDLLEVARLDRKRVSLKREDADLRSVVAECMTNFESQYPKREITFTNLSPADVRLSFDVVRIDQVLSNLIDNAIKYTPEDTAIELTLERIGDIVRVSVIDHGPGIPLAEQARIFSGLFRGSSKSTIRHRGLGLGLLISRELIALHDGAIGVKSEVGVGSTFYFELPINKGTPVADLPGAA